MEYFELFELPVSLKVDHKKITARYYQLSKQFHPDRYTMATDAEKQKAEQISSLINKAKNVLSDPIARLEYILQEKNLLNAEEKNNLPAEFLIEMMEFNESIVEAKSLKDDTMLTLLKNQIAQIENEIRQPVSSLFDLEELSLSDDVLLALKVYFLKNKYLQRMKMLVE